MITSTLPSSKVRKCISNIIFFFQADDGIRDVAVTGVQTCALPIWPAGGAVAAFPRRAAAARSAPGALSRRGAQRPRAPAVGVRRELESRRGERRKRRAHAACRRLREQRSFAAHLLALPPEPGAALAPAPARPAARRVLHGEAARGAAAAGELCPGGARDRRAHDARHQEPAAVAERALLGRGARP